jgi:hypothetical protein
LTWTTPPSSNDPRKIFALQPGFARIETIEKSDRHWPIRARSFRTIQAATFGAGDVQIPA